MSSLGSVFQSQTLDDFLSGDCYCTAEKGINPFDPTSAMKSHLLQEGLFIFSSLRCMMVHEFRMIAGFMLWSSRNQSSTEST
jgi:hypothetical protein